MFSGKAGLFLLALTIVVGGLYFGRNYFSTRIVEIGGGGNMGEEKDRVQDGFVHVHLQNRQQVIKIFFREINPLDDEIEAGIDNNEEKPVKIDVLLLHGRKFSSKTWHDLKTIDILARNGHRTVAVDLPGYGNSEKHVALEGDTDAAQHARGNFLAELIDVLGLIRPAIVSPSMSGSFSLPLLMQHAGVIGAYVPVAPVNTEKYAPEAYLKIKVSTLVVYGELDRTLGLVSLHNLRYLPNHAVVKLPNANHPAYLDAPDLWHEKLVTFLDTQKLLAK